MKYTDNTLKAYIIILFIFVILGLFYLSLCPKYADKIYDTNVFMSNSKTNKNSGDIGLPYAVHLSIYGW